jgi:hypothetical protein
MIFFFPDTFPGLPGNTLAGFQVVSIYRMHGYVNFASQGSRGRGFESSQLLQAPDQGEQHALAQMAFVPVTIRPSDCSKLQPEIFLALETGPSNATSPKLVYAPGADACLTGVANEWHSSHRSGSPG